MELRDRHPWRVGGRTIPLYAAPRVGMESTRGDKFDAPLPPLTAWGRTVSISTGCGPRANGGASMLA
jgi:hypothetical protein